MEIVLLGYKIGVGKDTLAREMEDRGEDSWMPVAYATKLKSAVCEIFGLSYEDVYTQKGKERFIGRYNRTVREILQLFGTEVGRRIHPNVWAHTAANEIEKYLSHTSILTQRFVLTDFRFPNEYHVMRARFPDARITTVRIDRGEPPPSTHASENSLDDFPWDIILKNDGTPEELYSQFVAKYSEKGKA